MTEILLEYDKYMTRIWQQYDRSMTNIWLGYDRIITGAWQIYDKNMTELWQEYDKYMTRIWLAYETCLLSCYDAGPCGSAWCGSCCRHTGMPSCSLGCTQMQQKIASSATSGPEMEPNQRSDKHTQNMTG